MQRAPGAIQTMNFGEYRMSTQQEYAARRLRRRVWITIAAAVLALLTVVLCALNGAFDFHKGNNLMPNLIGKSETAAQAAIEALGANVTISYRNSEDAEGVVIFQSLEEGEPVTHNQTISLVVSLGPEAVETDEAERQIPLPNFIGLSFAQASQTAAQLSVQLVEDGYVYDDYVPRGSIAQQTPAGGTMVDPNSTVTVQLSAGPRIRKYTITVSCGAGGTISPNGSVTVEQGKSVSFTITPNEGYVVEKLVIDGVEVLPLQSYTFLDVTANHTLSVTFVIGDEELPIFE